MNEEFRLRVSGISIVFGGLQAVSGLSFELRDGELAGLIGPNGAGKTTVFNMLSGIYTPAAGKISFRDAAGRSRDITGKPPDFLNKLGIARTFQNIRLFGGMSALDNIRVALHSRRRSNPADALFRTRRFRQDERELTGHAEELLRLFHIEDRKDELARNLSYGGQRRLEIARALASNPLLLLLDEPAAGMNPQETSELTGLISFIRERFRLTILLIEHDMKLVMGICERLFVLDYGRLIASGQPEEIRANPEVVKAYLGSGAVSEAGGAVSGSEAVIGSSKSGAEVSSCLK